jgi:hypothetical protein
MSRWGGVRSRCARYPTLSDKAGKGGAQWSGRGGVSGWEFAGEMSGREEYGLAALDTPPFLNTAEKEWGTVGGVLGVASDVC